MLSSKIEKFLYSILTAIFLISFLVSCDEDNPVSNDGKTIYNEPVYPSNNDVIINLDSKIDILIPKGSVPDGTVLKITEDPKVIAVSTTEYIIHKVYNITLGNQTNFEKPIEITFKYDKSKLVNGSSKPDILAAYFNESFNRWMIYKDIKVDTINQTITFQTNHLTPLGWGEYITSGGYTNKFVSDHFQIYYVLSGSGKVMTNLEYSNTKMPWHINSGPEVNTPYYIQDLSHWLEEAFIAFRNTYNLKLPKDNEDKINVYVKVLSGADGLYGSVSGNIFINCKLVKPTATELKNITFPDILKGTSAHELLHYIQDYYYVMNKGSINLWWLEALAINGDKMVWGTQLQYSEALYWSVYENTTIGKILPYNLSKSWDDCSGDPFHYLAGCFLSYLAFYDTGVELDIAGLLKKAGENTNLSYIRTILDKFLIDTRFTNISAEFKKYVIWLYEGNNLLKLPYTSYGSVPDPDNKFECALVLSKSVRKCTFNSALPYLSARLLKIKNKDDEANQKAVISVQTLPPGTTAYLYNHETKGANKLIRQLFEGDQIVVDVPIGAGKAILQDILIINSDMNKNLTPKIEVQYQDASEKTYSFNVSKTGSINYCKSTQEIKYDINFKVKAKGTILLDNVYVTKSLSDCNIYISSDKLESVTIEGSITISVSPKSCEFTDDEFNIISFSFEKVLYKPSDSFSKTLSNDQSFGVAFDFLYKQKKDYGYKVIESDYVDYRGIRFYFLKVR